MSSTKRQSLAQRIKKAVNDKKKQKEQTEFYVQKQININLTIDQNKQQKNEEVVKNCININLESNKEIIDVYSFKQKQMMKDPFIIQTAQIEQDEETIEKQIDMMVKQRQQKNILDDDEYKKQLILNTLKNKKKPRHPKPMDLPTPFNQLSPPYQQIKIFASYLPIYQQRRRRQLYTTLIDLGVKNLQQIIYQCFSQNIISQQFIKSIKDRTVDRQIEFVHKFSQNRLHEYNFQTTKFTPLDYRRLGTLLMKKSKRYIWGERIYCVFKEITDFYQCIFALSEERYQRLCKAISIRYNLTWWGVIEERDEMMMEKDQNNLDTSMIFQLRPCPMFGADLNDDNKQFFKSKKERYPEHYNRNNIQKKQKPVYRSQHQQQQHSQYSSSYRQSSNESSSLTENQLLIMQSQNITSSLLKSSSLKSSNTIRGRKKKNKMGSQERNSQEEEDKLENRSNQSDGSQYTDEEQSDYMDREDGSSQSDQSMYKSKSRSMSRRSSQRNSKKEEPKIKMRQKKCVKKTNKSERYKSESNISDEIVDHHNIFEDFDDNE